MPVDSRLKHLEALIFTGTWSHADAKAETRFTQDSPVLPAVWLSYAQERPGETPTTQKVLINPVQGQRAGLVARELRELTAAYRNGRCDISGIDCGPARIAHVPGLIVAELYFDELIRIALPSTSWWEHRINAVRYALGMDDELGEFDIDNLMKADSDQRFLPLSADRRTALIEWLENPAVIETSLPVNAPVSVGQFCRDFLRFIRLTVAVLDIQDAARPAPSSRHAEGDVTDDDLMVESADILDRFNNVFKDWPAIADRPPSRGLIWNIAKDRDTEPQIMASSLAIKADAAKRLFDISCDGLRWAIIDSGIDTESPAFRDWRSVEPGQPQSKGIPVKSGENTIYKTRIVDCFDFTVLRHLLHLPAAERLGRTVDSIDSWLDNLGYAGALINENEAAKSYNEPNGMGRRCQPNMQFWSGVDEQVDKQQQRNKGDQALDKKLIRRLIETARANIGLMQASDLYRKVDEDCEDRRKRGEWKCLEAAIKNAKIYLSGLISHIELGLELDWSTLEPFLRDVTPDKPHTPHGTQVAGILAADWRDDDPEDDNNDRNEGDRRNRRQRLQGICPDIELLDLRISAADSHGGSSAGEFEVIAAMQFLLHLNARSEVRYVHGANLSLSIQHDMQSYGCGQTRVCTMAEQLVSSGVMVVAAAGNGGTISYETRDNVKYTGYQTASITDPGNAEGVLTVGATHRSSAHRYGVSYFSSRGPTGDGRQKPELVAPGEKITTTSFGRTTCVVDGTSFAAPHASGAAALLMARHTELIGNPGRIKQILCDTATDLGRTADFQGAGMIDVLRAIQSI